MSLSSREDVAQSDRKMPVPAACVMERCVAVFYPCCRKQWLLASKSFRLLLDPSMREEMDKSAAHCDTLTERTQQQTSMAVRG